MVKRKVIVGGSIEFRSQNDLEKAKQSIALLGFIEAEGFIKVSKEYLVYQFKRELDYEGDLALLQQTEKELIWDLLERNDIEPVGYPMVDVGEVRE